MQTKTRKTLFIMFIIFSMFIICDTNSWISILSSDKQSVKESSYLQQLSWFSNTSTSERCSYLLSVSVQSLSDITHLQ